MNFLGSLRKLCLEPGVLFPIANVFLFAQSDNRLALGIAVANVVFSGWATLCAKPAFSPMRILACMVFLSALCSLVTGAILPALAGFVFAAGNFLASISSVMASLQDGEVAPAVKVVLHPATYYGLGYCFTGLMAGGGLQLLADPLADLRALLMVSLGMATIIIASLGMALGLMKSATPFWILSGGTGINTLAGLFAGNFTGAASCLFSMFGELRLGWLTHHHGQKDI